MKREILFRGKSPKGHWIYGMPSYDLKYIFNDSNYDSHDQFEIIPETVGQFTGLTDKNGAKIFEGDILKGGIFLSYEVKWDYEDGGWNITESALNFTVTGNIHGNPESIQS